MAAARWSATEDDEEVSGRTALKTYLVEAHGGSNGDSAAVDLLRSVGQVTGLTVEDTDEADLFLLRRGDVDFWCDSSLGRFWRLHTIAPVDPADKLRDDLVSASPALDNVWLPPPYLENLQEVTHGRMHVFALTHDRRPLHREGFEGEDIDYVTVRLWAARAAQTLRKLRESRVLPHGISIRSVKLRTGSDEQDGDYCVAEYFNHGKVTVSGTSFDEHTRAVVRILDDYRKMVERIERDHGIGVVETGGCATVSGDPIVIDLEWTLADLEYAVGKIFSCTEPFRLWGVPERVREGHYRARAVDLHVGGTLTFDIHPRGVVIRLPPGTCGNTVVRFLGGLQYHVNADVGTTFLA